MPKINLSPNSGSMFTSQETVDARTLWKRQERLSDRLNAAELKITPDAIIATVSVEFYTKSETDTTLSGYSTIEQTATQIATRVSTTDYNGNTIASLINQTATTITIQADKINLNGAVTANTYFKINTDGSMEAIAGKIGGWDITTNSLQTGAYNTAGTRYFGVSGISIGTTFRVTAAGALTATSGTIGGWTINSASGLTKGGVTLDATNERIYVGGAAYLYSYASGVIGISGQLRTTGNITSVGSVNAQGGFGVADGQTANLGNTVHVRFGSTLYLLTRDASGFVKATTVVPE